MRLIRNQLYSIALLIIFANQCFSQIIFSKNNWNVVGRGTVNWNSDNDISIKDCFIVYKDTNVSEFEYSFEAKATDNSEQVQIWSGFCFTDRDTRYAFGLRGGNDNDIYLIRYNSDGRNAFLCNEKLDFKPLVGKWYKIKADFWKGNIRVYLNDEKLPRIVIKDEKPLTGGQIELGGGWIETEYRNLNIKTLTNLEISKLAEDTVLYSKKSVLTLKEKEIIRIKQRKSYKPIEVKSISDARTEVSLNGNWLFMPEYQLFYKDNVISEQTDDNDWHIMNVPDFWNPNNFVLAAEADGTNNYIDKETKRCAAYTFDASKTTAAYYHQWIILPGTINNKQISINFDAVSKVAEVYVNGMFVENHLGMFGNFNVDISKYVHSGKNLIAVYVKARQNDKSKDADKNVARAVSVDINNDMLNSIPYDMFKGEEGGIWQPVKLVITNKVSITDYYAGVRTDGGDFEITLANKGNEKENVNVKIKIIDKINKTVLFESAKAENAVVDTMSISTVVCKTGTIKPKLWSPETPYLYDLIITVTKNNKIIDETTNAIGFRTFEVRGNTFYLNNKPYFIRGANLTPCGLAPNDSSLSNTFLKLMHDGNEMVTRTHGCPFTEAWMNAADKQGVGVSFEGTWPWLMIDKIPSNELLEIWKKEMLSLVNKYRNHPSLLIWTINNEMYFTMFYHNDPTEIRLKKWEYISDLIKEIRKKDKKKPVCADSGYGRVNEDYEKNLKPNNIDDGDIDDRHVYFGWYNNDFYQIFEGEWSKRIYWSPGANTDRPFYSQECSTGYPNLDNGHFSRKHTIKHYVEQSWVGDLAYEEKDPSFGLQRHAFMTKELTEVIRRTNNGTTAGLGLFSNATWFKNCFDAKTIKPYPVYEAVKKAYAPVLISAELFGRNFYAGDTLHTNVTIINNDINKDVIKDSKLIWEVSFNNKIFTSGEISVGDIKYYKDITTSLKINLPIDLPQNKCNCKLHLKLESSDKKIVSENEYDLLLANDKWLTIPEGLKTKRIGVFDLTGKTIAALDKLGIKYIKLKDLTLIRTVPMDLLIVANLDNDDEVPYNWEDVRTMAGNGLNVILVNPGKHLQWLLPDKIGSAYENKGRVVNMNIPEDSVFYDIEPLELSWWQQEGRERPRTCRRSYRFKNKEGIKELCVFLRPHVYLSNPEKELPDMSGSPLIEIKENKGVIVASEMELNMATKDPIAAKLLLNLIVKYTK